MRKLWGWLQGGGWRPLLLLGVVLAGAWGVRRLLQPPEMRLAGRYALTPAPEKFQHFYLSERECLVENPEEYLACYSLTGERLWIIRYPKLRYPDHPIPHYHWSSVRRALSPSSRVQAVISLQESYQTVNLWENGRPAGEVRLPLGHSTANCTVLANGDVCCWYPYSRETPIYLIRGARIRARGRLTIPPDYRESRGSFTFDGKAFVLVKEDGFLYYTVRVSGAAIAITPAYAAADTMGRNEWGRFQPYLYSSSLLVSGSGACYNARGRISLPTGWWTFGNKGGYCGMEYITGPSNMLIQALPDSTTLMTNTFRILNLRTGDAWTTPPDPASAFCATTPDGRYALVDRLHNYRLGLSYDWMTSHSPEMIRQQIEKHPPDLNSMDFQLYERPGRARARLSLKGMRNGMYFSWYGHGNITLYDFALSADAHTLYAAGEVHDRQGQRFEIQHYRW